MNSLDSRFLRLGDTFAQKFSRPGRYSYDFNLPILNRINKADGQFAIDVKESGDKKREGRQHYVIVRQQANKQLKADPAELSIDSGDVVMWSAADAATPGFSISGYSETDSFNSAALSNEALYTHAFGSPGEVEWEDANGHDLSGKIVVKMPQTKSAKDLEYYNETLTKGALVVIRGESVEPATLEISVGQTVFFAVEKADGVTITDCQLGFEIPVPYPIP